MKEYHEMGLDLREAIRRLVNAGPGSQGEAGSSIPLPHASSFEEITTTGVRT